METLSVLLQKLTISLGILSTALAATPAEYIVVPPEPIIWTQASIRTMIAATAKEYNVPQYLALELADIESDFDPLAKNPSSTATGIYQFISSTWKAHCEGDRLNPVDNTKCAMKLISEGGIGHWCNISTKAKLKKAGINNCQ